MNEDRKQQLVEIEQIAREIASAHGLEIVEFIFHSQGKHSLLRIDIDRPGLPGVGLADCEIVSRELGDRIEDLPFFGAAYELQLSSPGIDRPIETDDDIRRNAGRPVKVEYQDETGKVREVHGTLSGSHPEGTVSVAAGGQDVRIPHERIVLMKQDVFLGGRKRNKP